jgi:outer membrane lipoprotein SlyB
VSTRAHVDAQGEKAAPGPISPEHEEAGQPPVTETVPPIVRETLASPGEPLDRSTRANMDARFGYDFSRVRLHRDERAARSADAVGAVAYTVGRDVAFGRGFYQPHTSAGQRLLAHELAHVTQDEGKDVPASLQIGRHDDVAERQAEADAARVNAHTAAAPAVASRPTRAEGLGRTAALRRTTFGALLGAGLGAVGGALIGGLLGGPIGALVGGVVGLIGGAIVGEITTTRSRPLKKEERDYAHDIYLESVDYTKITITRDSVLAAGAPRTIGNTIHLKSTPPWNHFKGDTMDLSEKGMLTLIHEMGHVWQYQNGGLAYIPLSLIAQIKGAVSGGDRGKAYDWRAAHEAKIPWENWNPEQQAEAIEDYNKLLRKQKDGKATPEDLHTLSILLPYIEKVRHREGAPTFGIGGPEHDIFRQENKGTP